MASSSRWANCGSYCGSLLPKEGAAATGTWLLPLAITDQLKRLEVDNTEFPKLNVNFRFHIRFFHDCPIFAGSVIIQPGISRVLNFTSS